jgi:predicted MFS family arabinose efflux permease
VTERKPKSIELTLLFTSLIASSYGFGIYLFAAMVEPIRRDLHFSYEVVGTIAGCVQASFMGCALLSGILSNKLGPVPVILGAVTVCAASLGGMTLVRDARATGVLLTILGGCAVSIWVPMVSIVRSNIPPAHQGKALGLISSGTSYGVFLNSVLVALASRPSGWRVVWAIAGSLVTGLAIISFSRIGGAQERETRIQPVQRRDYPLQTAGMPSGKAAIVLTLMFLNGMSCMPFQTYLSSYLQEDLGLSVDAAASAWRMIGVVGMFGGFALGALADLITVRWATMLACALFTMSCVMLLAAPSEGAGVPLMYGASFAFGLAFSAIFALVPTYVGQNFEAHRASLVFAAGNVALGSGGIIGNVLSGRLRETTGSFHLSYEFIMVVALCSVAASTLLRHRRPN